MTCAVRTPEQWSKPVTVKVNGVAIPRALIAREVQNHPAPSPSAAWLAATRALVVKELLAQEVERRQLTAVPRTDGEGRRETEQEARIGALIDQDVRTPEPTDAECRRYYQQNRHRFRSADIYEASHILFAARADDPERYAAAQEKAASVRSELRLAARGFAALARLHSDCPSGAHGGNLGQITKGDTTPEFERALVALSPGAISEPVTTRYGVHIIRLDRKHDGRALPYALVAERIADYLRDSVRRRAIAQYIARLGSAAEIEGIALASADALRVG